MYNEGAPFYQFGEISFKGHDLAFKHIAEDRTVLPNHLFESFDYGAGASYFNEEYARQ